MMTVKTTPFTEYSFLKDDEIAVGVIELAAQDDDPRALEHVLEMLEEVKGSEETERLRRKALGDSAKVYAA
jgi:DNA-binding phage protein